VVLHSFYAQILSITLISSLNWEVWPKAKISALLAYTRSYWSKLISNLHFEVWPNVKLSTPMDKTRPYKFWIGKNIGKTWFLRSESSIILFLCTIISINLVYSINWEIWLKVKLSALIGLNLAVEESSRVQTWRKCGSQGPGVVLHSFHVQLPSNLVSSHS